MSNIELQRKVQDAINWEPALNAGEIGVMANEGVITLTGTVNSFTKKYLAELAAKTVLGVKAVIEKIDIQFGDWDKTSDTQIATQVLNSFKWNKEIPEDKIKVIVEDGHVTLEGELPWNYQKDAAKNVVSSFLGIKGVTNNIIIKPESADEIEKEAIDKALARSWSVNQNEIQVSVSGSRVILNGSVRSWYEKDEAGKIAWNAPGVVTVINELAVEHTS